MTAMARGWGQQGARLAGQLGLAGLLGLAMLLASAWAFWSWLPAQQRATDELGSQARKLRYALQQKMAGDADAQAAHLATPQAAWQALLQGLPSADRRVALQSEVLAAASRHGLRISTVQYQGGMEAWSRHAGAAHVQARSSVGPGLWRQRMSMPVEGPYVDLRAWLADLLAQPALAIDAIDIQRDDASRDQVKARVSVSLYWRSTEEARP